MRKKKKKNVLRHARFQSIFGRKEVEKRERNNTQGRAFSADRFTAKHLTMFGLFGVHLSTRRAKKKNNIFHRNVVRISVITIKFSSISLDLI